MNAAWNFIAIVTPAVAWCFGSPGLRESDDRALGPVVGNEGAATLSANEHFQRLHE